MARTAALTPEVIADAAIALVERHGERALTMRRLGVEVGVEAMSLYHHFEGRPALLHAMAGRLMEPLGELDLGPDWRAACATFGRALRGIAIANPVAFRMVALDPFDAPGALSGVERLLGVLVAGGHPPVTALAIYRSVASYARGYALAEAAGFTVEAETEPGRARLRRLPPEGFPVLRSDELRGIEPDRAFEFGLSALVAGLPEA